MSYILDALTESERTRQERAAAPKYSLLPIVEGKTPRRPVWPYVLAAGLLINAAVFYFRLQPGPATDTPVAGAAIAPAAPSAPKVKEVAAAPKPASSERVPMPTAPRVAQPLQAPPARAENLAASPAAGLREAGVRPAVTPAPGDRPPPPVKMPEVGKRTAVEAAAAKPAPSAPDEKPPQPKNAAEAADPAADAKHGLPAVSVSGFIHEDGSNGIAIINDKLVREGDEIAPGLILEKILGDRVVLNYKGRRFTP
jgi:general secretion pathway protein B